MLVQTFIKCLQHRVVRYIVTSRLCKFLYPENPPDPHILRDLDCIRTPRRNHFPARTDKITFQGITLYFVRTTEQPF